MRTLLPLLCCLACNPDDPSNAAALDAGDFEDRPWSTAQPVFTLRTSTDWPWVEVWLTSPAQVAGEGLVTIEELHVDCVEGSSTELGGYQLVYDPEGTGWFSLDGDGLHLAMVGTGAEPLDSEQLLVRFFCSSAVAAWGEVGAVTFDDGTTYEESTLVDDQIEVAIPVPG